MGAKIEGAGTPVIRVVGVARLHGATHAVTPDRIETGTYALAAAMAGGEVRLTRTRADLIEALLAKMEEAGVEVERAERRRDGEAQRRAAEGGRGRPPTPIPASPPTCRRSSWR